MATTYVSETLRGYFGLSVVEEMRWVASNVAGTGTLIPPRAVAIRVAFPRTLAGSSHLTAYTVPDSATLSILGAGRVVARATIAYSIDDLATLYGGAVFYTAIGKLRTGKATLRGSGGFLGWVTRPVSAGVPTLSVAVSGNLSEVYAWVKSQYYLPVTGELITRPRVHFTAAALLQGSGSAASDSGAGQYISAIAPLTGCYSVFFTNLSTCVTIAGYAPLFNAVKWVGESTLTAEASALFLFTDKLHPDINKDAGHDVIYQNATGLERALADVDAYRLIATYAELVRDQWDPYEIDYANLAHLAWAMGVNLWEDNWGELFRRQWVDRQWQLKYLRGSRAGLDEFVRAVGGTVKRCITPPATTHPLPSYSDEERAEYITKFPQLRMYPYVDRTKLRYKCYIPGKSRLKPYPILTHEIHSAHSALIGCAAIDASVSSSLPVSSALGVDCTVDAVGLEALPSLAISVDTILNAAVGLVPSGSGIVLANATSDYVKVYEVGESDLGVTEPLFLRAATAVVVGGTALRVKAQVVPK